MTTAEAIEGMTDAGEFEILALRVLRIEDDDCKLIEHLGVNASGKTIANPVDGFCLMPGSSPERFVMAAFTTERPENLKRKWLFDHSKSTRAIKAKAADDGDLIKASRYAEILKKAHPNAIFIIHLCTNRRLDDELMADVYKAGNDLGLQVKFLGQSRIRDCLDMKPEGQWLRKEHLGIDTELVSFPLLAYLSKISLQKYSQEFLITSPEQFITINTKLKLQKSYQNIEKTVYILSGASGVGKSVISYLTMKDHIDKGGIGLWIPGEIATTAVSLEEAIDLSLRLLHPTVQQGAGQRTVQLLDSLHQLLIIIDDINRGGEPFYVLGKILRWGKPIKIDEIQNERSHYFAIIVPVWENHVYPHANTIKSNTWIDILPLGLMSNDDGIRCLQSMLTNVKLIPSEQLSLLVNKLGNDPILMAIFSKLLEENPIEEIEALTDKVLERFITQAISETVSLGQFIEVECSDALINLTLAMIRNRDLYPTWNNVINWLPDDQIQVIRQLVIFGKICGITDRSSKKCFEFRHDRILEYMISKAFEIMLNEPDRDTDYLSDPFYAIYLGHTIAATEADEQTLLWVKEHNPLALFESIRYLKDDNTRSLSLVFHAKDYLSKAFQNPQLSELTLIDEACAILEETDSLFVLEITKDVKANSQVALARLANGDSMAGIIEFMTRKYFTPSYSDRYLENIITRALYKHSSNLTRGCKNILEKKNIDDLARIGAFTLAGYIASEELEGHILSAWESSANKEETLIPALWAIYCCGTEHVSEFLEPMFIFWSSLSDESEKVSKYSIALELKFALRHRANVHAIHHLVEFGYKDETLKYHILNLLEDIDNPEVVRFIIFITADVEYEAKQKNGFWPWGSNFRDNWDPTMDRGHRLSTESLTEIRHIWESGDTEDYIKETAFSFWVKAIDDIDTLNLILPENKYFKMALRRRILLRDISIVPYIKPLVASDSHILRSIYRVWSSEFISEVEKYLFKLDNQTPIDYSGGCSNEHYDLSHLLRDIPIEDSEKLLLKHWDCLKYSYLFLQLALYIGTEKCKYLADSAIKMCPKTIDPFTHISFFFGFRVQDLAERVNMGHLNTLLPYIEKLDDHTIIDMVEYCFQKDYIFWAERYLHPEFDRRRSLIKNNQCNDKDYIERMGKEYFPTEQDLYEKLDWIEQQDKFKISYWTKDFVERNHSLITWQNILENWFIKAPSSSRFEVAQSMISQHGKRSDLALLFRCSRYIDELLCSKQLLEQAKFNVMRRNLI